MKLLIPVTMIIIIVVSVPVAAAVITDDDSDRNDVEWTSGQSVITTTTTVPIDPSLLVALQDLSAREVPDSVESKPSEPSMDGDDPEFELLSGAVKTAMALPELDYDAPVEQEEEEKQEPEPEPKAKSKPKAEASKESTSQRDPDEGNVEQWRGLVATYFQPGDVDRALRIMWCESRGFPERKNKRSGASGLFQHLPKYWEERSTKSGWAGANIFDPQANVAVAAYLLYNEGGWGHWTCKG